MSITTNEQVKLYRQTLSYKKLMKELKSNNPSIGNVQKKYIIANLASNYYRIVSNEKNVWEDAIFLLQEFPYIVSVAEIVGHIAAVKHIYSFASISMKLCEQIFQKYSVQYSIQKIPFQTHEIVLITFVEAFESEEQRRTVGLNSVGRLIWKEIEKNKIKCGYCTLEMLGEKSASMVFLFGYRSLDFKEANKNAYAGFRNDLGEPYRSAWEANIARLLLQKGIPFTYETEAFELLAKKYFPDFILPNNIVLEVKGVWDKDSLSKVSEFSKLYKHCCLLPIDSDMYYDLNRKFKNTIANWEKTPVSLKEYTVPVVSLTHPESEIILNEIDVDTEVALVREEKNPHDRNTIAVVSKNGQCIGCLDEEWACVYAPKLDAGIQYRAVVSSISPQKIMIKIKRINRHQEVFFNFFTDTGDKF